MRTQRASGRIRSDEGAHWLIGCVALALAAGSSPLTPSPAAAGDEFETGFKIELGRIAAHEAVHAGRHILAGIVFGGYHPYPYPAYPYPAYPPDPYAYGYPAGVQYSVHYSCVYPHPCYCPCAHCGHAGPCCGGGAGCCPGGAEAQPPAPTGAAPYGPTGPVPYPPPAASPFAPVVAPFLKAAFGR